MKRGVVFYHHTDGGSRSMRPDKTVSLISRNTDAILWRLAMLLRCRESRLSCTFVASFNVTASAQTDARCTIWGSSLFSWPLKGTENNLSLRLGVVGKTSLSCMEFRASGNRY
jgi:hypothetical protein